MTPPLPPSAVSSSTGSEPRFWLLKTEPSCWSWAQQVASHSTPWDDVKNFQAQKHLKSMALGDEAFFYHTGSERQIVGIVTVVRTAYPDPSDPNQRFVMVDVQTKCPLHTPVTLARIKAEPLFAHLPLVTQGRLSVMPMDPESWSLLCHWGRG